MKQAPDKEILRSFPEAEREEISRLWDLAGSPRSPGSPGLKTPEIQAEWRRLQHRLQEDQQEQLDASKQQVLTDRQIPANKQVPSEQHISPERTEQQMEAKPRSLHANRHFKIGRSFRMRRIFPIVAAAAAVLIAAFAGWFYWVPVTIEAPRGTFVSHQWDDGVSVELNSGSQLTYYRSLRNGHRSVQLDGEAYFDIPTSEREFVVETHNARVHVLGTRFNVRSWGYRPDAETVITLVKGEVALASNWRPQQSVLLQPGQWSRVDHQAESPYEPEEVDTSRALAWRDQGFYFASASLDEVTDELERRFNREITLREAELGERNLTLYLPSAQDLESIVTSICHLTGCRYDWSDDQVVLY